MTTKSTPNLKDGAKCKVIGGVHEGKAGTVRDINTSKTGYVTITVVQASGDRFKTLAKNVVIKGSRESPKRGRTRSSQLLSPRSTSGWH